MKEWMNQSWWFYDLVILAIFVLCIMSGMRRGFIRAIFGVVSYLVAVLISGIIAEPIAAAVYDGLLADSCSAWLEEELEDSNLSNTVQSAFSIYGITLDDAMLEEIVEDPDGATEQICEAAGIPTDLLEETILPSLNTAVSSAYVDLPDWMTDALLYETDTTDSAEQLIQTAAVLLSEDSTDAAQSLSETYVRPAAISILKVFVFFVTFLLIFAVILVIIRMLFHATAGTGWESLNRLLGGALGCCQAILFLVLMRFLVKWLVTGGSNQLAFFNEDVIEQTILFRLFY
ncbi:MAG: CvpA family protein [Ruminococcus sp.]|nr:CvpA family protein [Ruminococcus sp.]